MSNSERRHRRRVLRPSLVLAALAALAVVLTPAGSAGTTSKPFGAVFGSTVVPAAAAGIGSPGDGGVSFTITDEAKNQQLGSANIYAQPGVTITGTDASPANLDPAQTFPATTLQLRNLNLDPPTTSASYGTTIYVSAPCGTFTWSVDAHQSNDYNSSSGNSLFLDTGHSSLSTLDAGSCHLAWVHQPASAITNTPITDTPFSAGNSVAVAVEDASNNRITGLNTGTATLAVGGSFDCGASCGSFSGTTSTTFHNGVATFPTLQSAFTGTGFTATASALGLTSPASSPPFVIEPSGANCIGKDPCVINGPAGNGQVGISGSGGNFIYMAFSSSTLPGSVTGPGGGCANFTGTHTDFAETDARNGDGTLTVTLSIKNNDLKQAYGPNYGQPNVPICVGVRFLSGNTPVNCDPTNPDTGVAWADRRLNSLHVFGGEYGTAVCDNIPGDAGYGYWWGVAGTYQDPNPPFDRSSIPLVTSWGGSGTSPSSTRTFVLSVPAIWDMQGHG